MDYEPPDIGIFYLWLYATHWGAGSRGANFVISVCLRKTCKATNSWMRDQDHLHRRHPSHNFPHLPRHRGSVIACHAQEIFKMVRFVFEVGFAFVASSRAVLNIQTAGIYKRPSGFLKETNTKIKNTRTSMLHSFLYPKITS